MLAQEFSQAQLLNRFLSSRRQRRLEPVRSCGAWEEHFANGRRYFYNNDTQRTQWHIPEEWQEEPPEAAEAGDVPTKNGADLLHSFLKSGDVKT
eukprot:symbB.v1.2.005373.t1/scaffold315.1/size251361/2